jgi:hypothetical protein
LEGMLPKDRWFLQKEYRQLLLMLFVSLSEFNNLCHRRGLFRARFAFFSSVFQDQAEMKAEKVLLLNVTCSLARALAESTTIFEPPTSLNPPRHQHHLHDQSQWPVSRGPRFRSHNPLL